MTAPRPALVGELLRRLAAAIRSGQLYSKGHPIIGRNLELLLAAVRALHELQPSTVVGIVSDEIVVDDAPVSKVENLDGLVRRLKQIEVERIAIENGVTADELATLVDVVARLGPPADGRAPELPALPHVRLGRVTVEEEKQGCAADSAAFRKMYREAVSNAEIVWESTLAESRPDATVARTIIDGLAEAVSQNRRALLALTTLKSYDNYTFTHMVNVSILTMGQARGLGIGGALLREFGLAALMHDIGKVKMPLEILNKAEKLTDAEAAIMKRHPVDGAEILRATPDMPILAPVVAFEHHLRLDGAGYPVGAVRRTLNVGTMLCSIADVYDAMRSLRKYQQAFPSDRILEVLQRSDGRQFDQYLVRRFAQLVGIYPAGNLVRLDTGEIAVVTKVHAPDPHRPSVKILIAPDGAPCHPPRELRLWEDHAGRGRARTIVAPVDPAEVDVDPLAFV